MLTQVEGGPHVWSVGVGTVLIGEWLQNVNFFSWVNFLFLSLALWRSIGLLVITLNESGVVHPESGLLVVESLGLGERLSLISLLESSLEELLVIGSLGNLLGLWVGVGLVDWIDNGVLGFLSGFQLGLSLGSLLGPGDVLWESGDLLLGPWSGFLWIFLDVARVWSNILSSELIHPWIVVVWVNSWSFLALEELHVRNGILSPE